MADLDEIKCIKKLFQKQSGFEGFWVHKSKISSVLFINLQKNY